MGQCIPGRSWKGNLVEASVVARMRPTGPLGGGWYLRGEGGCLKGAEGCPKSRGGTVHLSPPCLQTRSNIESPAHSSCLHTARSKDCSLDEMSCNVQTHFSRLLPLIRKRVSPSAATCIAHVRFRV